MNTSDYYGLNLVEGSDKFNPLIADVPNYEKIDEVMHDNAIRTVGLATEILAGNVHAITRENGDAPMFRFTATSNFSLGETFTVDGVQVTALTTSGETLGSGAFIIGTSVLACLVGSTMTVFTSGAVAEAEDSKKLGGQLPSYYGTAEAVSTAQSTANASGVVANAVNTRVDALEPIVNGLKPTVAWTNPNPSSQVNELTLDADDYAMIIIAVKSNPGTYHYSIHFPGNSQIFASRSLDNGACAREVVWSGDTITLGVPRLVQSNSSSNSSLIPTTIYGINF